MLSVAETPGVGEPPAGTVAVYRMLTAGPNRPPPLTRVEILCGPAEEVDGTPHRWWQLVGHAAETRRFAIQLLTSRVPLSADDPDAMRVVRFRLEHDGRLEYHNRHTGRALLPHFRGFRKHFLPYSVPHCGRTKAVPNTARYLGHVLSLREVRTGVAWPDWKDTKVLDLDPELLVGTGRNFKDTEGQRIIPKDQDYTYTLFVEADYEEMIDAGINSFTVAPGQVKWVRDRPVFYVMRFSSAKEFDYPGDLYRSNYRGGVLFLDEPTILMMSDAQLKERIHYFSDAAALIEQRVRERYDSDGGNYGSYDLDRMLRTIGCNLGAVRIQTHDYPEQLDLARRIKAHRLAHPRPSIMGPPRMLDTAVVVPAPYFVSIWNLEWIGELDPERKSESSRRYHALMRNALTEILGCLDRNEDFDVVIDAGQEITGYRRLIRVPDAAATSQSSRQ